VGISVLICSTATSGGAPFASVAGGGTLLGGIARSVGCDALDERPIVL